MSAPFALSYTALWVLVVLQGVVLLGLTRIVHQLRAGNAEPARPRKKRAERLAGQLAPTIDARDVYGDEIDSEALDGGLRAVLFVSPECPDCMVTLDELNGLQTKVGGGGVVAVCMGDTEECRLLAEDLRLTVPVVADQDGRIGASFDIAKTPTAVLVNKRGRIVQYGHPGRDSADLESLLRQAEEPARPVERESGHR